LKVKALILAAGYAKRLWPLTKNKPKPLLDAYLSGCYVFDNNTSDSYNYCGAAEFMMSQPPEKDCYIRILKGCSDVNSNCHTENVLKMLLRILF